MGDSKLVLLVDDDSTMRLLISTILRRDSSLRVVEAKTGHEALAAATAETPRLILLDMMLPDMSGLEVIEHLRERNLPVPPILAMTAASPVLTPDSIFRNDSQIRAVLRKPVGRDELMAAVESAMSNESPV